MAKFQEINTESIKIKFKSRWMFVCLLLLSICILLLLPFSDRILYLDSLATGTTNVGPYQDSFDSYIAPRGKTAWMYQSLTPVNGPPAANKDAVFISVGDKAENGKLISMNLSDGTEKWHYSLNSYATHSPVAFGEFVAIGDKSGVLHVVHSTHGHEMWTFNTGNPIMVSPIVFNGLIYVIGTAGVYCLDAQTGEKKWHTDTGNYFSSSAALDEKHGIISVLGSNENDGSELVLYLIQSGTGKVHLKYSVSSFLPSTPVISGTTVAINSEKHSIIAIDLLSRNNPYLNVLNYWHRQAFMLGFTKSFPMPIGYKWHTPIGGTVDDSILSDDQQIYILRENSADLRERKISGIQPSGPLTAIDSKDGSINWDVTEEVNLTGMGTLTKDGIIATGENGTIIYVEKTTGDVIWSLETNIEIAETPIRHGDMILITSQENAVYSFQ